MTERPQKITLQPRDGARPMHEERGILVVHRLNPRRSGRLEIPNSWRAITRLTLGLFRTTRPITDPRTSPVANLLMRGDGHDKNSENEGHQSRVCPQCGTQLVYFTTCRISAAARCRCFQSLNHSILSRGRGRHVDCWRYVDPVRRTRTKHQQQAHQHSTAHAALSHLGEGDPLRAVEHGRSLSRIILHFWNVHLWKLTSPPGLNVKVSFSNCRSKEVDDMGLAYCKLSRSRHPAGLFLPRRRQSAPTNTTPSPLARLQHRRRSHLICRSPSATPISSPALPTASADSGQCMAATAAGFLCIRRSCRWN